jgi:hypothetical protein
VRGDTWGRLRISGCAQDADKFSIGRGHRCVILLT